MPLTDAEQETARVLLDQVQPPCSNRVHGDPRPPAGWLVTVSCPVHESARVASCDEHLRKAVAAETCCGTCYRDGTQTLVTVMYVERL